MATITLTLEEYKELEHRERVAIDRNGELERLLVEAKRTDPENRITALADLCRTLMTITRFAVANLPPESIKGWPHVSLMGIAMCLHWLPDFSADDESFKSDLIAFSNEARNHEVRRSTLKETATQTSER